MSFFTNATTVVHDLLHGLGSFNPTDKYGLILAFAIAAILAFFQLLFSNSDTAAPPPAPSSLPFLGHALSYGSDRSGLLTHLREYTTKPRPYTLSVWSEKVYAFFHPRDLERVWENEADGVISWERVDKDGYKSIYGISADDAEAIGSDGGLMREFVKLNSSMMKSAPSEGGLFKPMIERFTGLHEGAISELLRAVEDDATGEIETDLLAWVTDYAVRIITGVIWGEKNPYAGLQTRAEKDWFLSAFTYFDEHSGSLLQKAGILSSKLSKGNVVTQRENVVKAFKAFYADPTETLGVDSAEFALRRTAAANEAGLSVDGLARMDVALLHASLKNTRPVVFWCLYYLFSDPKLLSDIRTEIKDTGAVKNGGIVDVGKVATSCRLLNSLWNEVLRYHHDTVYTRRVENETTFSSAGDDTTYTLRRGNDVVIPSSVLMRDPWIWGETADVFDAYRFSKDPKKEDNPDDDEEQVELRKQAFRPFGGGERHCPGRGFAWVQVATLIATFVTTFDVDVLEKKEKMRTRKNGLQMVSPVGECRVRIKRSSEAGEKVTERIYVQP